jgi:[ribosomal protein S5]-alanine N-acetyltransferase
MRDDLRDIQSIETDRLLLRRMRPEDTDDMVAMHQDDRFVEAFGVRSSEEHVREFTARQIEEWDRQGWSTWALRDRASGEFAGRGGIRPVTVEGVGEVELGYAFRPEWWGRGLAVEMSRVALDVGFHRIGLESIVAFTMPANTRSRRVMEKLGMTFEREFVWADIPHVLYRLRRGDYASETSSSRSSLQ